MKSPSSSSKAEPASQSSVVPLNINDLPPGTIIDVETKSRSYHIECLGGSSVSISGHPTYCPAPTPAHLQGGLNREGGLDLGLIERGSRLLIFLGGDRPFTTSRVLDIHIQSPPAAKVLDSK